MKWKIVEFLFDLVMSVLKKSRPRVLDRSAFENFGCPSSEKPGLQGSIKESKISKEFSEVFGFEQSQFRNKNQY